MKQPLKLGYLVFGVAKPRPWQDFCARMLGLPDPVTNVDGSRGYRLDEASQRLILQEHPEDDLLALGLDCGDPQALQERVDALRAAGLQVRDASQGEATARRVQRLCSTQDPAGNTVELFAGLETAPTPFRSTAFPGGFRTGELGIGHAVLVDRDVARLEDFYVGVLGFAVTERLDAKVGPIRVRGTFLHCNARHHSLALFDVPSRKRLHHFMLQAREHMDVGCAFERASALKVPISLDIGQHPDPDGTFSFYGTTPSGFDFEIGAGGREIVPEAWHPVNTTRTSSWGHRPRLRLKLRAVADLAAGKLRG